MFGNKKMYKKGLADAMQAYEGFSEKQKAALEQMRREVDNGDELNGIYQYLNAKEKAALYHLNTPLDIKKLELEEQQLLVAVLYQLAEDEDMRLNDNQRNYIRSVQRYLGKLCWNFSTCRTARRSQTVKQTSSPTFQSTRNRPQ